MELPPKHVRFTHTPLNFKNKEIRLVKIEQSSGPSSPIQITIQNVDFSGHSHAITRYDEEVLKVDDYGMRYRGERAKDLYAKCLQETPFKFIALSYTWGPELPAQDVLVTSSESRGWLSVRQNLYDFLKIRQGCDSVRQNVDILETSQDFRTASFWIDQICINQGNNNEKAHQVHQMAEIYGTAHIVEAWLGPGFEGSDELVDLIIHENNLSSQSPSPRLSVSEREMRKLVHPLSRMARLPYWTRLWVTQEIVLGRVVHIRVGSKTLLWDAFYKGWLRLDKAWQRLWETGKAEDRKDEEKKGLMRIYHIHATRIVIANEDWSPLSHLVRGTECSNIRDRVFGMMGMLKPSLRVFPDYSMHPQDILLQLLTKQIEVLKGECHPVQMEDHGFTTQVLRYFVCTAAEWLPHLEDEEYAINRRTIRRYLLDIVPLHLSRPDYVSRRDWKLRYYIWSKIPNERNMLWRILRKGCKDREHVSDGFRHDSYADILAQPEVVFADSDST